MNVYKFSHHMALQIVIASHHSLYTAGFTCSSLVSSVCDPNIFNDGCQYSLLHILKGFKNF